jgi:transcription factor CRZ1
LLEEEAQEKGGWDHQNQQMDNGNMFANPMPTQNFGGMMPPQPGFQGFPPVTGGIDPNGQPIATPQYGLPAALLAQYPALAGIQWDSLPPGPPEEVEGDISGRSSFDASSGGELFEEDEGDYPAQNAIYGGGWASDYEANAR